LSSVNAEAPRSCPSDGVPLLMVADPPLPGDLCYLNKTSENRHLSEMDGDSTDAVVVVDMDALPCLDAVAEQTDVSEERPETPLTPSLDPEFLRRLEEEDMPRRVLRSSTIASTEHSKHHAAQRSAAAASSRHKTASLSSSHSTNNTNNAISPRKRNPQSRAANRTPKKQTTAAPASSGVQYDPIEVKISDDVITPCAPSSSGLSSVSSVSSCASYRSKGSRKKRRIRIDKSNWKPVCSGSRQYVYFTNDVSPVKRVCYKAVRHVREPETLHVRDSVVVKALDGTCNYGKVTRIFLDEDSE
uniref:Nonstructural protein n=1 Tax=Anisakis simplex TaxID=6269 RepID=A0A0M3J5A9_ANISI